LFSMACWGNWPLKSFSNQQIVCSIASRIRRNGHFSYLRSLGNA
jgi:hypothetical protein